jgi:hypothetical protein
VTTVGSQLEEWPYYRSCVQDYLPRRFLGAMLNDDAAADDEEVEEVEKGPSPLQSCMQMGKGIVAVHAG